MATIPGLGLDQFIRNIEATANGLKKQVEDNLLITANDATDDIVQRIKQTGKDAEGQPFRDYTPRYKAQKKAKGRYSGHVDFTDTNTMLRSIGVHGKSSGNGMASVTISPIARERSKLEKNEASRGDIIKLSKKEQSQLEKDFNRRNLDYFKRTMKL